MQERRKFQRFNLKLPAKIKVVGSREKSFKLVTRDVCAAGAFFKSRTPLAKQTRLEIDLIIKVGVPGNFSLTKSVARFTGKVTRSEVDGIAVAFDEKYHFGISSGTSIE